jgi:hypothetical protein
VAGEPGRRGHPFLLHRLKDSPEQLARVRAAKAWHVSERRFGGWEPTTFYERDAAGRIVSSTPEAEWTPEQQGWALALAEYEASLCEGCGHDLAETLSTEAEDWKVLPPLRCAACTRLAMDITERSKGNEKRTGGGYLSALRYLVVRRHKRR